MSAILVYITVPDTAVALKIAEALVNERLAACVNILPIHSVYRWERKICQGKEKALIIKTTQAQWENVHERVISLHLYECPAIIALPVTSGHNPFLSWIEAEVG